MNLVAPRVQHAIIECNSNLFSSARLRLKICGLDHDQMEELKYEFKFLKSSHPIDAYQVGKTNVSMAEILDHLSNSLGFELVTVTESKINNTYRTFYLKKTEH